MGGSASRSNCCCPGKKKDEAGLNTRPDLDGLLEQYVYTARWIIQGVTLIT